MINRTALIAAALYAANVTAQDVPTDVALDAAQADAMAVAADALASAIDERERPDRELARCMKEKKKAERKAVWGAIAIAAVSGAGNAYASQRTATFNYRGSDGYRSTSTIRYTDSYDLARRNRESAQATAQVIPGIVAAHLKKTNCADVLGVVSK